MKTILLLSLLILFNLYAKDSEKSEENVWDLYQTNFYFENDLFRQGTDNQYSSGEKLGAIFTIDNSTYFFYDWFQFTKGPSDKYLSFSIANQIFTPEDLNETELIVDDRPYAGWTFLELGIHQSSSTTLESFYIQIGAIGPRSYAENIQKAIHKLTDSTQPMGWDNQLKNELGVNLRYIYKLRREHAFTDNFSLAGFPQVELDLGNVSTQATVAFAIKIGWNIPKDFGKSNINSGGETGIQAYQQKNLFKEHSWSFALDFDISGSLVARDIFLDGNLIQESHSVEKESFVRGYGSGFSLRYKTFALDYIYNKKTKQFTLQKSGHGVGSIVISHRW